MTIDEEEILKDALIYADELETKRQNHTDGFMNGLYIRILAKKIKEDKK